MNAVQEAMEDVYRDCMMAVQAQLAATTVMEKQMFFDEEIRARFHCATTFLENVAQVIERFAKRDGCELRQELPQSEGQAEEVPPL